MIPHSSARSVSSTDYPDNRKAVWGGNTEMLEKTRAYQERAKKALKNGIIRPWFPNPWRDDDGDNTPDITWRLRVFELAGEDSPSSRHFDDPRELLNYWRSAPSDVQTTRRVVILEGMNVRMVELLGVLLDIPPEFFLAHCCRRTSLSVVDRFYAKKGSSAYWKVEVPQRRRVPAGFDGPQTQYIVLSGLFRRGWATVGEDDPTVNFYSPVSYWGSTHGDSSWTAVVIVDSSLVRVRKPKTGEDVYLEKPKPHLSTFYEAIVDPLDDEALQPYERCLFDAMVDAYSNLPTLAAGDLFTATALVRNLIRSAWEDDILRMAAETVADIYEHEDMLFEGLTTLQQSDKLIIAYQDWISKRRAVRENLDMLRLIIWTFCHQGSTRPHVDVSRETDEWRRLEQRLEDLDTKMSNHMETYAQLSIMRESFEGYRQTATSAKLAKSSGRLLNLATIFVPFTLVASIFSMNGNYAAGESHFFIFWAVSIPCALALIVWVMYTEFWVRKWKNFRFDVSWWWFESVMPRILRLNFTRRQLPDEEMAE